MAIPVLQGMGSCLKCLVQGYGMGLAAMKQGNATQHLQALGRLLEVGCKQLELTPVAKSCLQLGLGADRPGRSLEQPAGLDGMALSAMQHRSARQWHLGAGRLVQQACSLRSGTQGPGVTSGCLLVPQDSVGF